MLSFNCHWHWSSSSLFLSLDLDSGLSLTTVRDATEFESDQESKEDNVIVVNDSKTHRSLITKRTGENGVDTDSDDVFVEVCFHCSEKIPFTRSCLFFSSDADSVRSQRLKAPFSTTALEKNEHQRSSIAQNCNEPIRTEPTDQWKT